MASGSFEVARRGQSPPPLKQKSLASEHDFGLRGFTLEFRVGVRT